MVIFSPLCALNLLGYPLEFPLIETSVTVVFFATDGLTEIEEKSYCGQIKDQFSNVGF